ncbi:MAG: hypothetical protein O3B41_11055 [Bacteroidetes bacterium]|nr:hypothetical protein [Bacteroidota bacterium]
MNRFGSVILLIVLIGTNLAVGQERREIGLKADNLQGRQVDGRTVFDLIRPVLTQKESVLKSDFGIDEGDGFVRFWGNVEIMEVEDTLRADRVRYNRDTKIGEAEGNVYLSDGVAIIRAPSAVHYSEEDRTEFDSGVEYSDSLGVLHAPRAIYYSDINQARFFGGVLFSQDDIDVSADSVSYTRDTEISEAWGKVFAWQRADSASTFILTDYLFRDAKSDSMEVVGYVRLANVDLAEADTVFVIATAMSLVETDSLDSVIAQDSVIVSTKSYALRGDSLVTQNSSIGGRVSRIFGNPMAWLERTQVSADSLSYRSTSRKKPVDTPAIDSARSDSTQLIAPADSLFGFGHVFVATEDSSSGRIQQISGRLMTAILKNDSLKTLIVEENAEALFYTREFDEDPLTAVSASGDGVVFYFEEGDPVSVGFYSDIKARYYAENLLNQLSNLSGYIWKPELMPDRAYLSQSFWNEVRSRQRTQKN